MSKREITPMNIADIEPNARHLYLLNTTKGDRRGPIHMSVPKLSGSGSTAINIPLTWIPVDILDQCAVEQLIKSSDFRRMVSFGVITIVSEEDQEKIMKRPGATEEKAKVRDRMMYGNAMAQNNALEPEVSVHKNEEGLAYVDDEDDTISMRTRTIMEDAKSKDEMSVINTLRNFEDEMNEDEWQFVMAGAKKLKYRKLVKYCRRMMDEAA